MSKAILILDMPKECAACPLRLWDCESKFYNACMPTLKEENSVSDSYSECDDLSIKPNWCPLKPIPKRMSEVTPNTDWKQSATIYSQGLHDGWNMCVVEITGETDEHST